MKRKKVDTIFQALYTQTELFVGAFAGLIWAVLDCALGGIDTPIKALAILICLDFITGVSAGYKTETLDSRIGFKGICKKAGIFVCIIFAYLLDLATSMNMFRGMVISGFAIIEAMSLLENVDRLGYGAYIPSFLRNHLEKIAHEKHLKEEEANDEGH